MATVDQLQIQIEAVNQASGELRRITNDLRKLEGQAGVAGVGAQRSMGLFSQGLKSVGRDMIAVAGGIATFRGLQAGIQGTVGAAIAFESSFAGIRKTVDATEQEFGQIAAANRSMAKELPATANEINRIGELAGQLGVRGVDNIVSFERVIVDLANTTNLTAEESATAFAQIANVMELPIQNLDRLGSSVVDLGNKSATTERDIVAFTQRIAGSGKIAGLAVEEVAGIGAAFASVGVEAERGGTAIQKVLVNMTKAVAEGGKELDTFSKTAGLSVEAFQNLARSDPAEAFTLFVEGLGRAGDEAFNILADLGLADQRLIQSFLSVAGAGDLVRRSIETSTAAFKENTALTIEAEKRYETTAAQLSILRNNIADVGISLGQILLPALAEGSQAGVDLLDALRPLGAILPSMTQAVIAFAAAFAAIKAVQLGAGLAASVQQLVALQVALASGMTTMQATGAVAANLGRSLLTPTNAAIGLGVAFVGLDLAARKFTGAGIVDHLTGAAAAAEEAARRTESLNYQLERTEQLITLLGEDKGTARLFREQISAFDDLVAVIDELGGVRQKLRGDELKQFIDTEKDIRTLTGTIEDYIATLPDAGKGTRDMAAELRDMLDEGTISSSTFGILNRLLNELAAEEYLASLGADQLEADMISLTGATQGTGSAVADAVPEFESFADAIDAVRKAAQGGAIFDPMTEGLKLQIAVLEQQRRQLQASGQDTEALDSRIAALKNTLDTATGSTETLTQAMTFVGAVATEAFGGTERAAARAGVLVEKLRGQIEDLPAEQQVEIIALINQGSLSEVYAILALLKAGVEVPIAFRVGGAASVEGITSGALSSGDKLRLAQSGVNVADIVNLDRATQDFRQSIEDTNDSAQHFASGGGASAKDALDILADGAISLGEATEKGLSPAQAAVLELGKASDNAAEAAFRQQVELHKTAIAFAGLTPAQVGLRLGLKAIADELERSGRSVTEFLRDLAKDAANALEDAFSGLFRKPTREGADLDVRIAQRELELAEAEAAGASDEKIERIRDSIEALRRERRVLDANSDLYEARFRQADQTLLTEEEQAFAAELYIIALKEQTLALDALQAQATLEAIAKQHLIDSMLNAAEAYNATAGISAEQSNLDFFNSLPPGEREALARLLEELAKQGRLAGGTDYWRGGPALVGERGPEIVNIPRGSQVIPADETKLLTAGTPAPIFYNANIYLQGDPVAGLVALGVNLNG